MKFKRNITKAGGKYTATLFMNGKKIFKASKIETLEGAKRILNNITEFYYYIDTHVL